MCLALPGKLLSTYFDESLPMGEVDFSGVKKTVCLAFTPDVKEGEYVIVHVGFSISVLNEEEAQKAYEICG